LHLCEFSHDCYLELAFLDFAAFNVYLEDQAKLSAYLKRLQNIAGIAGCLANRIGSRRNGEIAQAPYLEWQIRTHFRGCAAPFVYAWRTNGIAVAPIMDWILV